MVRSWRDLIFRGKATYDHFPDSLALGIRQEADRIDARVAYLRESLDLLSDQLSPPVEQALRELQAFHEASCQSVIEPPGTFHTLKRVASHGTDGFDSAWFRHRDLLSVSQDDRDRLEPRVDERLADIDQWADAQARTSRRDRLRTERERFELEDRDWRAFLEAQKQDEERAAARLRALREHESSDRSTGGDDSEPDRQERE